MGLLSAVLVGGLSQSAGGQDWPQWRGPHRDGALASFDRPESWPEVLTGGWKVEVGLGYATPLLVGDRLYVFTRQDENEVVTALDPGSGRTIWRSEYPAPFAMNPATSRHGPGPKSTPTFAGNRLFTLGMSGIVSAFDTENGRRLWHTEPPTAHPLYHTATSPLVDGDRVIVHVGGHNDGALTAFDAATGRILWSWNGDGPAYGSPMIFELAGVRQVVTFTQEHFVGVDVRTGELLWQRPYQTQSTTTSQTPILYRDTVIETGRGNGVTAFRVVREGDAFRTENLWHTDEVSLHLSNGVVLDGMLFGLSHLDSGRYFALDLDTGEVLWTSGPRQAENAAIVRAGSTIFSLEDDGELVVFEGGRGGFEVEKRYEVAESATWAQPTISGRRVFIKDVSTLALWTLH